MAERKPQRHNIRVCSSMLHCPIAEVGGTFLQIQGSIQAWEGQRIQPVPQSTRSLSLPTSPVTAADKSTFQAITQSSV